MVVPAKRLATAKTRLSAATSAAGARPGRHDELVLALLGDAVAAACASPAVGSVLVVTDEPSAAALVQALGADVVADEPDSGLNAALAHGAATARRRGARAVASLSSDLGALRPAELTAALEAAGGHTRAFVADADGTGTTLLAAVDTDLDPRFGTGSAAAHAASGAARLPAVWPGLARDVDTAEDLARAVTLGLGQRTTAWFAAAARGS